MKSVPVSINGGRLGRGKAGSCLAEKDQSERTSRNAHKSGLSESKIGSRFWSATQASENVSGGAVCHVSTNDQILVMQSRAMLARLDDYASSLRVLPDAVSFG